MAKHDVTLGLNRFSAASESAAHGNKEHVVAAYRAPQLHVAGTAVEMVQGSWGPVKDVGGYNCYDFR